MDVIVYGKCPKCMENMNLSFDNSKNSNSINFKNPNWFFEITKNNTLKSMVNEPFFEDLFEMIGKRQTKENYGNKAMEFIRHYAKDLEIKIGAIQDKKELMKLGKIISKLKLVVKKDAQKEMEKQKAGLLQTIKKKMRILDKQNTKKRAS